jgi:UPF0042 nucleotide-binding protein
MKLFVVSGVSGSGKSTALHVFEDIDFYCIDNLPVALLPAFAEKMASATGNFPKKAALGIDARNMPDDIPLVPETLKKIKDYGISCEVIFLNADDDILIKRFSETRRKHPLTHEHISLADAIKKERKLLDPIANCADLIIDTSRYNVHQLRDQVKKRVTEKTPETLSILVQSFGFKHGVPSDADFVFDTRCLPNPHWIPQLRSQTGLDKEVVDFLDNQPMVKQLLADINTFLEKWIPCFEADNRSYMTISVGCTGGQHRSVYLAEQIAEYLMHHNKKVITRHRELA